MTLLANIRRKRCSASILSAVLLAWVGVLAAPCAMALLSDAPTTPSANVATLAAVHADCSHSIPDRLMSRPDCCCDLTEILPIKTPEVQKPFSVLISPIEAKVNLAIVTNLAIVDRKSILFHGRPQPVYLATQRLRI